MKYVILLFSILLSYQGMGQTGPLVEYKDGPRKLQRLFGDAYTEDASGHLKSDPDTTLQFFEVLFTVDSSGRVGDRIIVTLVGDTARMPPLLIGAIRNTSGQWINHTGRTIWVEQPFSYRYGPRACVGPNSPRLLPSRMDVYQKGGTDHSGDFIRLSPIDCEAFEPIYDRLNLDALPKKN